MMVMTMMICVSLGPKGKWGLECGSAPAGRLPCSSYKNYPALLVSYIQQKNYPALLMRSHKKYYRWQKIHQGWPPIAWVCTFLYFLIPRYLKSQISKSTEEYQFDNCCGSLVRNGKGPREVQLQKKVKIIVRRTNAPHCCRHRGSNNKHFFWSKQIFF